MNHAIIKMFHRVAVVAGLPALLFQVRMIMIVMMLLMMMIIIFLFQASIFRVFQQIWRDLGANRTDQSLRELAKFVLTDLPTDGR